MGAVVVTKWPSSSIEASVALVATNRGFSGSAATPLGWALGMPWIGAVHGYWSSIDDTNRNRCVTTNSSTCAAADIVDKPGSSTVSTSGTLFSHTDRDADSWGVALEFTTPNPRPMILPGIMKSTHWGAAFDVRGLDQDLHIKGSTGGVGELFNYKETLDTTYYGGYVVFGGEYSLFPALYGGWGLRSFIDLHAGIYGANADYNGHFVGKGIGDVAILKLPARTRRLEITGLSTIHENGKGS